MKFQFHQIKLGSLILFQVKDRTVIQTTDAERRVSSPAELQEGIDGLVKNVSKGRSFVRYVILASHEFFIYRRKSTYHLEVLRPVSGSCSPLLYFSYSSLHVANPHSTRPLFLSLVYF